MKNKIQESSDPSKHIRILNINKKRFVIGLQWRVVKSQRNVMKEIKQIGKRDKLDVVAIRQSDAIQAGFAPKSHLKLRGSYSLIVSLASLLEGCCIAVVPLGMNNGKSEFTLVGRTEKGGIHPKSDEIYTEDELEQTVIDLRSALKGNKSELEVKVYGDTESYLWATHELSLEEILTPKNLTKDFKLKPLTWGMTKNQLIIVSIIIILSSILLIYLSSRSAELERKRQVQLMLENQRNEEINKAARYKTALSKISHPWIEQPSVQNFIASCDDMLMKIPLSLEGWKPTAANCTSENISVSYARQEGSSAELKDFVKAVHKRFDVASDFHFMDTNVVTFTLPIRKVPNGDDPLQSEESQLLNVISLFQSLNIASSFTQVPIVDVKENDLHEPMPLQDWQAFKFEYDSETPPQLIFAKKELVGTRLTSITFYNDMDSGTLKYNVKGEIYAQR
jgi:hypothetical protein